MKFEPRTKSSWRGAPITERELWTRDIFIMYPRLRNIVDTIDEKLLRCERLGISDGLLIKGETGAGKTKLADLLRHRYRIGSTDDEVARMPVLSVDVPLICSPRQFALSSFAALGERFSRQGSPDDLRKQLAIMMGACQTRVFLLDNFHDIPARRAEAGITAVGNWLRELFDATKVLFVFLGKPEAEQVLRLNEQLRRRVPFRTSLNYFSAADETRLREFKSLMMILEKWIPLADPSGLQTGAIAMRLYCATNGIMKFILETLDLAVPHAVADGREHLVLSDLEMAFQKIWGEAADMVNPFSADFQPRSLNKAGEPFEDWN
jgi:Bacterial TniB protein